MRVLVICSKVPPALAPESAHAIMLCEQLTERGIDVHLLTSAFPAPAGDHPFVVHGVMPSWGWKGVPTLTRHIRSIKPDVILLIYVGWIYEFHPMMTYLPTLCRLLAPRSRFVTQFENVQLITSRWTRRLRPVVSRLPRSIGIDPLLGTLASQSRQVIVLSERHLDLLRDIDPIIATKAALIPPPPLMKIVPDPTGSVRALGRGRLGLASPDFVVAYYGLVYPTKGIDTLLRALAMLRQDTLSIHLVMIGGVADEDYGAELHRLADELGVTDRVEWVGECEPSTDTGSILIRAADVIVLPFDAGVRTNNSSFAVAAAHGQPIVTTEGSDLEEPFRHGENVWLCPPRDPLALAGALNLLIQDNNLRERLGAGAQQLAADVFSWERNVSATLAVLRAEP